MLYKRVTDDRYLKENIEMNIDGFFKIDHKCKQNQGSGSSWIIKTKVPRRLDAAPLSYQNNVSKY